MEELHSFTEYQKYHVYPFLFKSSEFSAELYLATIIFKAGQFLKHVGTDFRKEYSSHGQLRVATPRQLKCPNFFLANPEIESLLHNIDVHRIS